MKRILILSTLLVAAAWSADYSSMSTDELLKLRGTLSQSERPAFKAEMQKRMQSMTPEQRQQMMQGRGMGQGKGMGQGRGMGGQGMGMQNRPTFSDFDLDKDGKITPKELSDAQAAHMAQKAKEGKMLKNAGNAPTFESIDTNKDGTISNSEFTDHQTQQMKAMRGQGMKK